MEKRSRPFSGESGEGCSSPQQQHQQKGTFQKTPWTVYYKVKNSLSFLLCPTVPLAWKISSSSLSTNINGTSSKSKQIGQLYCWREAGTSSLGHSHAKLQRQKKIFFIVIMGFKMLLRFKEFNFYCHFLLPSELLYT